MESIDPAGSQAPARQELAEVREDPRIQRLALRHAGHPALADDALQSTYYVMARLKNLEQIQNLRAYFRKILIREIHRQRSQLGAIPVDDLAQVGEARQDAVDDEVCSSLQAQAWLERFAAQRQRLQDAVPTRSDDPVCYKALICTAAGQVLRDSINGQPSEADTNPALRAAYPEYFDQPDIPANTRHQRFRRARDDIKALLQKIIDRNELT